MTRTDKMLIIFILVLSLAGIAASNLLSGFLPDVSQKASNAVVKVGGRVVRNVSLTDQSDTHRIEVKGALGVSVLQVDGGKVRVISSPCPDKLCVKQGWVAKPGEAVICVPNEVSVTAEGDDGVDAIIR